MNNKLAILIPTIVGREEYLNRLLNILEKQCPEWQLDFKSPSISNEWVQYSFKDGVVIILKDNKELTTGTKRNVLTALAIDAGATHRAMIDDDDTVSEKYLELNMPGVYGDYDCNSLVGIYSVNGYTNPKKNIFLHSLKYTHWYEDDTYFYRNPNHLNTIKLSLIKDIKFQDKTWGEDGCWSEDLAKANVLKKEYEITQPFYNYLSRTKVNGI